MFDPLSLPWVSLALLIRAFCFEPFNTPAASMTPTLVVGDYLFVAKAAYGYSRYSLPFGLPLFTGRWFADAPQRGDVVVFRLPSDTSISYVKRVIGLPGDRIQLRHGRLLLNDQLVPRRSVGDYSDRQGGTVIRLHEFVETLPREAAGKTIEYSILQQSDDGPLDDTPVYVVPPGHYFVLGDNRDNSQDSRMSSAVGYIPAENLIGRAALIYYSTDGAGVRFDRLLKAIH